MDNVGVGCSDTYTNTHTHTAQNSDALAFQECLWANWKQPSVRWMIERRAEYFMRASEADKWEVRRDR